ncbi:putative glycolipid-binding domain-containing protein [Polaromonas aquatica]|uniref:putative glycolipid-binding domain-containing protein n=1 Tax=Polaromonas aquatica TaxID=332657 RepID=UPI003D65F03F
MRDETSRTICWLPTWNSASEGVGLEHLLLTHGTADSVVLAVNEDSEPFRLVYRLQWDDAWQLRSADFSLAKGGANLSLNLRTDGKGHWQDGEGRSLVELDGCMDIDIWPTPFTNSFPILRQPMAIGERRTFRMAWVCGPDLTVKPQPQAYTRIKDRLYLFESLDGSGFKAELPVDGEGIVLDYPELFQRVKI